VSSGPLDRSARSSLALQRWVAYALAPLTVPAAVAALRLVLGYRIEGLREVRSEYRRIRREVRAPLLLCANHLTLIDSFLIGWALGSPWFYLTHFGSLAWNLPEQRNFAATRTSRMAAYVLKCLPIRRGGPRGEVAQVLERFAHLLARGEVGLVFPEGGRSRTGRIDPSTAAYGVGRVVRSVPGCRVLCVYLRGDRQDDWSNIPVRGERFSVSLAWAEPKSEHPGLRGSQEMAQQIAGCLAEMERRYFDGR
jgi:hypothetical protein